MLRVVFIIESEHSAAARCRVLLAAPAFEREGVDIYPMMLPSSSRSRRSLFKDVADFDAVVLQRRLIQPWDLFFLRRNARVLGYDFDDAVVYRDSDGKRFPSFSRRVKFTRIVKAADFITAGNDYLAGLCDVEPDRKFVMPTPVDTDLFRPAERCDGPFRVGWTGSASTLKYLESIMPAIETAAREIDGLELVVVSDEFPSPAPSFMRAVEWNRQAEAAEVARFDVGVMPLPDNPWTRGKCGFKLLVYGACGVPSVASPVGVNPEIIADGDTGILASGEDEWTQAIVRLARERGLGRAMGAEARRRVVEFYSIAAVVPRWAEILKTCASRRLNTPQDFHRRLDAP